MKHNRRSLHRIFMIVLVAVLLSVLAYALFATYDAYAGTIVSQQQQHLLIISRAVSKNLDLYLSEQLRDMDILIGTPGFSAELRQYYETGDKQGLKEYILSFMLSQHQGLSRIYLLGRDGDVLFKFNQYPFLEEFDEEVLQLMELSERGQTGIGNVFQISEHHFGLTLVSTSHNGDDYQGAIVGLVDLKSLYDLYVSPLDVRDAGYITVKDQTGTVIMHPETEMIAFNYRKDAAGLATEPVYQGLYDMLSCQYEYEEGTAIYDTYGAAGPGAREIAAFSRMNIDGISWFVSAAMSYDDAIVPINENLSRFALLVFVILVLLVMGVTVIYRLQRNRQKLQMETRYLKDINHTLDELNQSREQVRHYQKLQTIGTLTGGIAHEFNNLLTPILGYSEFLKEQLGQESDYYEDVDEIFKAGARAKEIVQQILPFSRRESDASAYLPISLDKLLEDALRMVRMILPSSIQLEECVQTTGVNIFANATQIHQVLLNLCSNAYQAMERDGGTLTVMSRLTVFPQLPEQFRGAASSTPYAEITVADTGCGMSAELLGRIFDPFFTTKEVGQGTGLGLSVVQNIVNSHEGFIEAKSVVGEGSRFIVYLPVTENPTLPGEENSVRPSGQSRSVTLLLVDDETRVLRYLQKRLTKIGYTVDAHTSSESALHALRGNPFGYDLLIADYTMPKCKGTVLAEQMKKFRPDLPVLLITGLVEKDALQMQQAKIIDKILIKPLDFNELLEAVGALLS